MNTLVCAATSMELRAFPGHDVGVTLLVTGPGIPCALASVLDAAGRARPDRIINIGIAGAYPSSGLGVGDIVIGASEVYGDIGFELPEEPGFRSVRGEEWASFYREPLPLAQDPEFSGAPRLPGCTVNTCTGTEATGCLRERLFGAAFETMEGAAVAHAGRLLGVSVVEVRAISNIAARRDMQPASIHLAVQRLADYLLACRGNTHA